MAFTGKYEFEGDENYDAFVQKIGESDWGQALAMGWIKILGKGWESWDRSAWRGETLG